MDVLEGEVEEVWRLVLADTLDETQIGLDHVLLDATPSDVRENARNTQRNSLRRVTVLGEVRLLLSGEGTSGHFDVEL